MIQVITGGESHGKGMSAVVSGLPSNLRVDTQEINHELARRQKGYGRGGRMKIETDQVEFFSGVPGKVTNGAPVSLMVWNKDWENWMDKKTEPIKRPRPGHADLTGALKYAMTDDIRRVLERSSARETAARVAAGALIKLFLKEAGISIFSRIVNWGGIEISDKKRNFQDLKQIVEDSEFHADLNPDEENRIREKIDKAKEEGDTLGGIIEVIIDPVLPFLGSYQTFSEKLDARIAAAALSVQAVKGIEFGIGFEYGKIGGKQAHDEIYYDEKLRRFYRRTNRAGGIEGGMSNGSPIVFRCPMKPIPTLMSSLNTVDMETKQVARAVKERSDVTAVPACAVVLESAVALPLADAVLERWGGDDLNSIVDRIQTDEAVKNIRGYAEVE